MKSFKEFINESIKKIKWDSNPKIGWWEFQDPLVLYHGTHERNIEMISKNGITNKDPETGMISMALEPNTAFGYAAMSGTGGEANFRKAGNKVTSTPPKERAIFVAHVPWDWVEKHYDKNLKGNLKKEKERLSSEEVYNSFTGVDASYYQLSELRFNTEMPARFIVGYMQKG
jgi:hypothetical protein